ncbi:MAG: hypothetical protein RIS92_2740 [Verrucomicrobiota bacterium]
MPRLPRTPPRKEKLRGDATPKKGPSAADPPPSHKSHGWNQLRIFALSAIALCATAGYLTYRLCQTPQNWPLFPLAEVGQWPLEQKLYNSLSTDRASTLEVSVIDINRHLARHLLAHPAIGAKSPSLEAVHVSGHANQPEIAARFRWKLFPLHLRATASRTPKENRDSQDTSYSITEISIGTLRIPEAVRTPVLNWFNPLMATLKREKYLLKRSVNIVTKPEAVLFNVRANPVSSNQTSSPKTPEKPSAAAPFTNPAKAPSPNPNVPKALPTVPKPPPKAERVP